MPSNYNDTPKEGIAGDYDPQHGNPETYSPTLGPATGIAGDYDPQHGNPETYSPTLGPATGIAGDFREFYSIEKFWERGGWKYPQEYLDIMKKIENGIVPENASPDESTLEIAREIYRSETKNRVGGELFNLYVGTRYRQLTDPNANVSPKMRAKLYEELVTIIGIVDQTVRKGSILSGEGWHVKNDVALGENSAMSVERIMKDLYVNREKYGLPEYLHLPVAGGKQAPWGVLDPNRTVETCPVTSLLSFLAKSSFGTPKSTSIEEIRGKLNETPEERDNNFKEQSEKINQAEQEWVNEHGLENQR